MERKATSGFSDRMPSRAQVFDLRARRKRSAPGPDLAQARMRSNCLISLTGGQGRNRTTDTRIFKRIRAGIGVCKSTSCSACPPPQTCLSMAPSWHTQSQRGTFLAHCLTGLPVRRGLHCRSVHSRMRRACGERRSISGRPHRLPSPLSEGASSNCMKYVLPVEFAYCRSSA